MGNSSDDKFMKLTYASSLTDLCEVNSSFDAGILRIAYPGTNQNHTNITKEVFEKCLPSIYNCPVVCHYDPDTDTIGSHDMKLVKEDDGTMQIVNLTSPVGVVPQNAKIFWDEVEEEDGTTREYLCAEVLIWKRQQAYKKIKEEDILSQSMEINVKDGKFVDGIFYIYDFEFTAFALISVEPCFESASLMMLDSDTDLKGLNFVKSADGFDRARKMMYEFKKDLETLNACVQVDNRQNTKKGGNDLDKSELVRKYNINIDDLDFSINDLTTEELEKRCKEMGEKKIFELSSNLENEIRRSLSVVTIPTTWNDKETYPRYELADYDTDKKEIYCWDRDDWLLYGFSFTMDGDIVVIDFDSKKRMKYAIVEFDGTEQESPFQETAQTLEENTADAYSKLGAAQTRYQTAEKRIRTMQSEIDTLKQFKASVDEESMREGIEAVFSRFGDLEEVEEFINLREECEKDYQKYDADTIEEKCYAIRGRNMNTASFSLKSNNQSNHRIRVPKREESRAPYGGLFDEYGFRKN